MKEAVLRRKFTVEEYHRMHAAGILTEDDRVELLEGEILAMAPISSRHAACVNNLARIFQEKLGKKAIVSVQNPIRIGEHSEPQPDIALLKPRPDFYFSQLPGPENVLLLVEVAETSVSYDRDLKIPLYFRAGIPEVWLVDLESRTVTVFTGPKAQGYAEERVFRADQALFSRVFPDLRLTVQELLPF